MIVHLFGFISFFLLLFICHAALPVRKVECGINVDPHNQQYGQPTSQQIQQLNATWARIEFIDYSTGSIQPSSYPLYDPIISSYTEAGISILMILDYQTYTGVPSNGSSPEQWYAYFSLLIQRSVDIAQHYQTNVSAYEIWNEEDLTQTYVPPELYGILLKWIYGNLTTVTQAPIIVGGLASGQPSYLTQVMDSTGGQLFANGVGLHPYGQRPFPNWPNPTWGFGLMSDLLNQYSQILPVNTPLWITEVGTNDFSVQGLFPAMTFDAISLMPGNPCVQVFWFCWSDGMVANFGVVQMNGTKTESFFSFAGFAGLPFSR